MTAKEQSQLRQNPAQTSMISVVPNGGERGPRPPQNAVEQPQEVKSRKQPDGTFIRPKCAALFSHLRDAHWQFFGIPSNLPITFDIRLMHIAAVEPDAVYGALTARIGLLEVYKDYEEAIGQGNSSGMTEKDSRDFAARKTLLGLGKVMGPGTDVDRFIREFDLRITVAKRVKSLVDNVGVIDVLLISFDDDEIDDEVDIPIPRFMEATDEEWTALLAQLLAPSLQLKETCLKLSGIAHMIQQLNGTGESEVRSFLAQEIRRRVEEVFGNSADSDQSDDDDSMADAEPYLTWPSL